MESGIGFCRCLPCVRGGGTALCAVPEGLQIPALVRDFACQSLSQPAGCQHSFHKGANGVRDGHAVHRQYRWRKPQSFHLIRFAALSTFSARRRLTCGAETAPQQKNPGAEAPGFSYVRKLHGEPVRQRIGDRINDRLRLVLTALAEDIGSDAKTNMNRTHHNYFTPFVRFPTPSHTIDDIGWLVLPVTSALYARNGQSSMDTYTRCVTN